TARSTKDNGASTGTTPRAPSRSTDPTAAPTRSPPPSPTPPRPNAPAPKPPNGRALLRSELREDASRAADGMMNVHRLSLWSPVLEGERVGCWRLVSARGVSRRRALSIRPLRRLWLIAEFGRGDWRCTAVSAGPNIATTWLWSTRVGYYLDLGA